MKKNYNVILYEGNYWNGKSEESIRAKINDSVEDISDNQLNIIFEYMVDNGLLSINGKKESERLRFVGSFIKELKNCTISFYCFPKYLKQERICNCRKMSDIIKVILRTNYAYDFLHSAEYVENESHTTSEKIACNKLATWLVADYSSNGVFCIKENRTSPHKGKINWTRTISKKIPLMDGDDIVYANPIRKYIDHNDEMLLSKIHRTAVVEAIEYLRKCGETVRVNEPDAEIDMKSKLVKYSGIVKKYQRIVFAEREIKLFRALEAWCNKYSKYYEKPIGTVSFELVWEDALREVFGNIPKGFSFGAPEYRLGVDENGAEKKQMVDNDSIPDIINIFKEDDNGKFLLLDAKYYTGMIGSKTNSKFTLKEGYQWIIGFPGYKDIAKQYDYYQTLVDEYGLSEGINAFIIPWYDVEGIDYMPKNSDGYEKPEWARYLGYAYKGDIDHEKDSVWQKMLEIGLDNKVKTSSEMRILVVQVEPSWLYSVVINNDIKADDNAMKLWNYLKQYT